jgi:large subunit ribosomal protein L19
MSELIESIERSQLRRELPRFREGDRVRIHFQVVEGTRRRTQVFEGVVIRLQGSGSRRTFTVRKLSFGVGVERTFPLHSPKAERIEVVARGQVRRAKLYYLRGRVGRRARVRERRDVTPEELMETISPADAAAADGEALPPEGEAAAPEEPEGPAGEAEAGEEGAAETEEERGEPVAADPGEVPEGGAEEPETAQAGAEAEQEAATREAGH